MADVSPSLSPLRDDDERKETSAVLRLSEAAQDSVMVVMGRWPRFALRGGGGVDVEVPK